MVVVLLDVCHVGHQGPAVPRVCSVSPQQKYSALAYVVFSRQSRGVLLQVRCKHAAIQRELGLVGVSETKPKKLKINRGRLQALGLVIAIFLFCCKKTKVKASLPTKGVNVLKNYVSASHGTKP